jgi:cobalamin biosynthesis protein CobT
MQQEVKVTFTGATIANVAGQAAAFAKSVSAVTGEATTAGAARTGKVTKTAKGKAAAETESEDDESFGDEESDETEASFDGQEDEEGESFGGDEESDETEDDDTASEAANAKSTPAKNAAAKGKKPKLADVNAALIAYTKKVSKSRDKTKALLLKKFKVETVNELKESQYAAVIEAFKLTK